MNVVWIVVQDAFMVFGILLGIVLGIAGSRGYQPSNLQVATPVFLLLAAIATNLIVVTP